MEIKIVCVCGAKFAFEIEPVGGRMPFPINCPECNADTTGQANEVITSETGEIPVAEALPISEPDPVPAPVAAPVSTPRPAPVAGAPVPKLTLSPAAPKAAPKPAPAPVPMAGPRTGPPSIPAVVSAPVESVEEPEVVEETVDPEPKPKKKRKKKKKKSAKKLSGVNFPMGVIGGLCGAVAGTVIWYCLARYANMNFGIIAWVIGGLVGFGAKIGAGEDSDLVAICSAVMALLSILGGQYLAINALIQSGQDLADVDMIFEFEQEMAKEIVAAKTDRELTRVLNEMYDEEFTPADIKEYKERDLPFMKRMANGSATKAEYRKFMKTRFDVWEEFKTSLGIRMYIWIFFGIGTAYRIPGGGTED